MANPIGPPGAGLAVVPVDRTEAQQGDAEQGDAGRLGHAWRCTDVDLSQSTKRASARGRAAVVEAAFRVAGLVETQEPEEAARGI